MPKTRAPIGGTLDADIWLQVVEIDAGSWVVLQHDREGGVEQIGVDYPSQASALGIARDRRLYLAAIELTSTYYRPRWWLGASS